MINLSIDELKLVAKNRGIKNYKNKAKDDLIKTLSESKKKSHPKKRIKDIKKGVNLRQIRKSHYGIKNHENLFKPKMRQIRKILYSTKKRIKKIFLNQK